MDSRKVNSREYQRQAIDAEIKSLEGSIRTLRHRRNAIAPISSLPTEVIAFILSISRHLFRGFAHEKPNHLAWLRVTHVCHHWREIALNNSLFWSHIDFTDFTSASTAEMLVRAKKAPLHLTAWFLGFPRDHARFIAFTKELQSHVANICHLDIRADAVFLRRPLKRLSSPAPTLESLSLGAEGIATRSRTTIPDTLFGGTAPRLFSLKLCRCNISWKSPLLNGLRSLQIYEPSKHARPSLADWLDALDQMPQLKNLDLHSASPIVPPFPLDVKRTVTLPFLTDLNIYASAGECSLALSHLVLPVLTKLCIEAKSDLDGSDVLQLLPYVARHSHGPQDTQPLQNIIIRGYIDHIEISAYPDTNVNCYGPYTVPRVELIITRQVTTEILDAAMATLPLDNLLKLTALANAWFDELFWHIHAPRWPLLESVLLGPLAARGFREMILQDKCGHENPLFPSLTNLALYENTLAVPRALRLRDALMKRVDQGLPLETLELRSCYATGYVVNSVAFQLLSEIVVDVSVWGKTSPGPAWNCNDSGAEDYADEPFTSDDDEGWDAEEIDEDEDEDEEEDYSAMNGD